MAEGQGSGQGGGRKGGGSPRGDLKTRVKTARKRSLSSTLWLERQLNDPYVAQAKRDGYRSRAAYKLLEIDERYRILRPGQRVVDLGAAPGGWSQIAARKTGADKTGAHRPAADVSGEAGAGRDVSKREARVIGIDLLPIDPIAGVEFAVLDFLDPEAPERLRAMLGGPADVVLSDMAANTTGHKKTDHLRIVALAELAIHFAREVLSPGGVFLSKVFQGGTEAELLQILKSDFAAVHHVKPKASRAGSAELYVLATGFRGERPGSGAPEAPSEG